MDRNGEHMTGHRLAATSAARASAEGEEMTFYVLVPVLGKPGEYVAVFADGSMGPATPLQLRRAAGA